MSILMKIAVAIDSATREEILHHKDVPLWLERGNDVAPWLLKLETSGHYRRVSTPDEQYHIYKWDWEEPDPEMYLAFKTLIESRKHSILEISEDGNIWTDVETSDRLGCDEEFEEILGWTADIILWNNSADSLYN